MESVPSVTTHSNRPLTQRLEFLPESLGGASISTEQKAAVVPLMSPSMGQRSF